MSVDPLLERLPECQNFNKNHVSDSFVAFMKETRKEDVGGGSVKRRRKKVAVPGLFFFSIYLHFLKFVYYIYYLCVVL